MDLPTPLALRRLPLVALSLSLLLLGASAHAAGRVLVTIKGGTVKLVGDQENNDVSITQNGDGTATLTGNSGTVLVNVATGEDVTTMTVTIGKDLVIDTRGGDDTVIGEGLNVPGSIKIKDNIGNNNFQLSEATVGKHVQAGISAGNGHVSISNSTIRGNLAVTAGNGNDHLSITNSTVSRNTLLKGGGGDDDFHNQGHYCPA